VEKAKTQTQRRKSDTDTGILSNKSSNVTSLSANPGRESRSGSCRSTDATRKIAYDDSSELRQALQKKIPEKLAVPEKKSRKNTFGSISYTFDSLGSDITLNKS